MRPRRMDLALSIAGLGLSLRVGPLGAAHRGWSHPLLSHLAGPRLTRAAIALALRGPACGDRTWAALALASTGPLLGRASPRPLLPVPLVLAHGLIPNCVLN